MKGGKKHTSAANAIFELHPNPNHAIMKGVTAIPGVTLNTTAYGAQYLLKTGLIAAVIAKPIPIPTPIMKPIVASYIVMM